LKLHKNLCDAIANGIDQIFIQGAYTHQVVEQLLLSNKKWGARDRNFIAEHLYSLVRYQRLYCYGAGIDEIISHTDIWKVLGVYFLDKGYLLPIWPEWADIDSDAARLLIAQGQTIRKIRESIPDWLDEIGSEQLGDQWDKELHALNETAPLYLRVNTLKSSLDKIGEYLRAGGIEFSTSDLAPDAIIIHTKNNLRNSQPYKDGWFEVQDISSQQVARVLDPRPGMTVIDACAGAGGKALHIAALMQAKGEVIAIDLYPDKLKELENRARRNGAGNVRASLYSDGMEGQYRGEADRLLLDVPCSALGVMRRNPDTKWKLKPEVLDELIIKQRDILERYSIMVKTGGIMVYATCSILPSENEDQIAHFMASHPGFEKLSEEKIMPHGSGGDGFYICKMVKNK
jgi:16S rRNA (cytosine967-C5)-methyltransferase